MPKTKEHILWPAAIIILLVSSVLMMIGVLIAARSDGGARVVDNYYNAAVNWDSLQSVQRRSDSLGWDVSFKTTLNSPGDEVRGFFVIRDNAGKRVPGVTGSVILQQPHRTSPALSVELNSEQSSPGEYSISFPGNWRGLIDVVLSASKGLDPILFESRIER
jgi:nitrogen fixation protein FixH